MGLREGTLEKRGMPSGAQKMEGVSLSLSRALCRLADMTRRPPRHLPSTEANQEDGLKAPLHRRLDTFGTAAAAGSQPTQG